jgi:hypothetical protein
MQYQKQEMWGIYLQDGCMFPVLELITPWGVFIFEKYHQAKAMRNALKPEVSKKKILVSFREK